MSEYLGMEKFKREHELCVDMLRKCFPGSGKYNPVALRVVSHDCFIEILDHGIMLEIQEIKPNDFGGDGNSAIPTWVLHEYRDISPETGRSHWDWFPVSRHRDYYNTVRAVLTLVAKREIDESLQSYDERKSADDREKELAERCDNPPFWGEDPVERFIWGADDFTYE